MSFSKPVESTSPELGKDAERRSESERSSSQDIASDEWATDIANPRNWSGGKKWAVTAIVSSDFDGIFTLDIPSYRCLRTTSSLR